MTSKATSLQLQDSGKVLSLFHFFIHTPCNIKNKNKQNKNKNKHKKILRIHFVQTIQWLTKNTKGWLNLLLICTKHFKHVLIAKVLAQGETH